MHVIKGLELTLLPDKAVYIKTLKTLIVTDIHIGKTGHFRKAGMAIPAQLAFSDTERLSALIEQNETDKLIVLGDMFHSKENYDMELFTKWRKKIKNIKIILIKGNHDILPLSFYKENRIDAVKHLILHNDIKFVHKFNGIIEKNIYIISGHVHPAIYLH